MPTTPAGRGSARPASEINAEIRGLVEQGGVGSEEYLELLVEWAAAQRSESSQGDVAAAA